MKWLLKTQKNKYTKQEWENIKELRKKFKKSKKTLKKEYKKFKKSVRKGVKK